MVLVTAAYEVSGNKRYTSWVDPISALISGADPSPRAAGQNRGIIHLLSLFFFGLFHVGKAMIAENRTHHLLNIKYVAEEGITC